MSGIPEAHDTVLIVDDSTEELEFLTDAIERAGFSALVATSGAAALTITERITPDLVLMDAIMPEMDGFETCRRIKANALTAHVPVIFITGLSETEHIVRALESGGVDYLTKPINIDELQARIRVHLANAKSAQNALVALDAAGRYLLAISRNGHLRWMTPQATRLVAETTGDAERGRQLLCAHALSRISDGGTGRTSETIVPGAPSGLQLNYLGALSADEHLFRLSPVNQPSGDTLLRQYFGLTLREAEVLLWIARGKTNRDIGDILGLSARTVNKHLEQVYVKLGVENRAAAAVRAVSVLHDG